MTLSTLIVAMLPFVWSEDATCDNKPQALVSGLDILRDKHDDMRPAMVFAALLGAGVVLGFLVKRTPRAWLRLVGEVTAGLAALGTSMMCVMMMTYGRPEQPLNHPAAWIGTIAALGMAVEVWWGAGEALRRGVEDWRRRKGEREREKRGKRIAEVERLLLRVGEIEDEHEHEDEHEYEYEREYEHEREHGHDQRVHEHVDVPVDGGRGRGR